VGPLINKYVRMHMTKQQILCGKCDKVLTRKRTTEMCLKCLRKEPKSETWKNNRSQNMMGNRHAKGLKYKEEWEYVGDKNKRIRQSPEYTEWRTSIFTRDNYTCVMGGKEHGDRLNADHIKRFSDYPELRFDVNNGRTLCVSCHRKTDTYGNRKKVKQ